MTFLTPKSIRHLPFRQVVAAHVGVYARAIKLELNSPTPCPEHVENLCTDYNNRMRLLHYVTRFEEKLKAELLDDVD